MKEVRFTPREQIENPMFVQLLEGRYFRLLGIMWTKYVKWWIDQTNMDIVFQYE